MTYPNLKEHPACLKITTRDDEIKELQYTRNKIMKLFRKYLRLVGIIIMKNNLKK